jgi:hypothetical protein
MSSGIKSAITLTGLLLMLVVASAWGWSQITEPFPGKSDPPICVDTTYEAGDEIYPQNVTVSVLNASDREGLAGRTMQELVDEGFAEGNTGNAPKGTEVQVAEVWTTGSANPGIGLVKSHLGGAEVRTDTPATDAAGVVIVVGDLFESVVDGKPSVTAKNQSVICSPPVG